MRAAVYKGGKRFILSESKLIHPREGEVTLKVAYCGVCGTDIHIFKGHMDHRVDIPQVVGHEVSGEILEIGEGIAGLDIGDKVVVRPLMPGDPHPSDNGYTHIGKNLDFMGIDTIGGMQGYWTVPAYTLHRLPSNTSLKHAALIEPLAVACHDVRRGRVQVNENVVVLGGGPIGILIALVARAEGGQVLISEVNEKRIAVAEQLGFKCVNPLKSDLRDEVDQFTQGSMADVVFEVSGSEQAIKDMTSINKVRGRIVMVAIHSQERVTDLFKFFWQELEMIGARVYEPEDFEKAIGFVCERTFDLDRLITGVVELDEVQMLFETLDSRNEGMKYLIECS